VQQQKTTPFAGGSYPALISNSLPGYVTLFRAIMKIKPKVFISSTIADFHDLRTAIKFYLEELGYEVLVSECNDFQKTLDKATFEACLEAIDHCEFYVLLIGHEVGSLWDPLEGISITRAEYRRAKSLAATGRIRMLLFARQRIWNARKSWKAANNPALGDSGQADTAAEKVLQVAFADIAQPEFVFAFLEEVSDTDSASPTTNWVHPFSTFRDVVDAMRVHLGLADSLQDLTMRANLRREIMTNLSLVLQKGQNGVFPTYSLGANAYHAFEGSLDDRTVLPASHVKWAVLYAIYGGRDVANLRTRMLDRALERGYGLEFDAEQSAFKHTELSEWLYQLRESISRLQFLRRSNEEELLKFATTYLDLSKQPGHHSIPNNQLLFVATPAGEEENCVQLLRAILLVLEGQAAAHEKVKLNSPTPIKNQQEEISWEEVSLEEALQWATYTAAQDNPKEP